MKFQRIFLFFLIISTYSFGQTLEKICNKTIYIQGTIGYLAKVNLGQPYSNDYFDSTMNKYSDSLKIKIILIDCFGSASVEILSKNAILLGKGKLCGIDSLHKMTHDIFNDDGEVECQEDIFWYEPTKCGLWTYYDIEGRKIREIKY
jgi:hypothetical protein